MQRPTKNYIHLLKRNKFSGSFLNQDSFRWILWDRDIDTDIMNEQYSMLFIHENGDL